MSYWRIEVEGRCQQDLLLHGEHVEPYLYLSHDSKGNSRNTLQDVSAGTSRNASPYSVISRRLEGVKYTGANRSERVLKVPGSSIRASIAID